ncbi:hypothetical protein Tco_0189589 [Tanacetum coccineum]
MEEEFIPHILEKEAPLFLGPQRDPNEPLRFIWNKDLFCLKNGNTKAKKYVTKVFKRFNEEARLAIHHWKHPWAKMFYRKEHRKVRSDPSDVYSNQKIVEVNRVKNQQGCGQYFMEEIVVKRADEVDYQKNRLLKSLTVFIRSCVIWEIVHEYQLGIESYQIKINLTAPTLVIYGIKKLEPYTIITDPFIGVVYENSKKEIRVMNIDDLPKFYDATLKTVLRKVEEINVEARYGFKDPPLSKEEKEVMC